MGTKHGDFSKKNFRNFLAHWNGSEEIRQLIPKDTVTQNFSANKTIYTKERF